MIATTRKPSRRLRRESRKKAVTEAAILAVVAIIGPTPIRVRGSFRGTTPDFVPTPEQIRQCRRAIRATWTKAERQRRKDSIVA